MSILGSEKAKLIRTAPGSRNSEGRFVPGSAVESDVWIAIQPGGKDTVFEFSGYRYSATRTFLTTTPLRTVSQFSNTEADVVCFVDEFDGLTSWRIIKTRALRMVLPHFEGMMGRLKDPEDDDE